MHEPHDYMRNKHLVASMKTKSLDVYFVQETWLEGDAFDEVINGYHIFRHNRGKGNHNFHGVAIILSPRYYAGWKNAGGRPAMTSDAAGKFAGWYISINVTLKSYNRMEKQIRGKKGNKHIALTLASIYHPCTKIAWKIFMLASLTPWKLSSANSLHTTKSLWVRMSMLTSAGSMNCSPVKSIQP
jgi:hypothetical protein